MKKIVSLLLVILMISSSLIYAEAEFKDVPATNASLTQATNLLVALGIIYGYEDGSFKPEKSVTRAEMAKMMISALGYGDIANDTPKFTDCKTHWAKGYISLANDLGIIEGVGSNKFSPDSNVTYEQAAVMLLRTLGYTNENLNGGKSTIYNAAVYTTKALNLGLYAPLTNFNVDTDMKNASNRGDIALMINVDLNLQTVKTDEQKKIVAVNDPICNTPVTLMSNLASIEDNYYVSLDKLDEKYKHKVDLTPYLYQSLNVYKSGDSVVYVAKNHSTVGKLYVDENGNYIKDKNSNYQIILDDNTILGFEADEQAPIKAYYNGTEINNMTLAKLKAIDNARIILDSDKKLHAAIATDTVNTITSRIMYIDASATLDSNGREALELSYYKQGERKTSIYTSKYSPAAKGEILDVTFNGNNITKVNKAIPNIINIPQAVTSIYIVFKSASERIYLAEDYTVYKLDANNNITLGYIADVQFIAGEQNISAYLNNDNEIDTIVIGEKAQASGGGSSTTSTSYELSSKIMFLRFEQNGTENSGKVLYLKNDGTTNSYRYYHNALGLSPSAIKGDILAVKTNSGTITYINHAVQYIKDIPTIVEDNYIIFESNNKQINLAQGCTVYKIAADEAITVESIDYIKTLINKQKVNVYLNKDNQIDVMVIDERANNPKTYGIQVEAINGIASTDASTGNVSIVEYPKVKIYTMDGTLNTIDIAIEIGADGAIKAVADGFKAELKNNEIIVFPSICRELSYTELKDVLLKFSKDDNGRINKVVDDKLYDIRCKTYNKEFCADENTIVLHAVKNEKGSTEYKVISASQLPSNEKIDVQYVIGENNKWEILIYSGLLAEEKAAKIIFSRFEADGANGRVYYINNDGTPEGKEECFIYNNVSTCSAIKGNVLDVKTINGNITAISHADKYDKDYIISTGDGNLTFGDIGYPQVKIADNCIAYSLETNEFTSISSALGTWSDVYLNKDKEAEIIIIKKTNVDKYGIQTDALAGEAAIDASGNATAIISNPKVTIFNMDCTSITVEVPVFINNNGEIQAEISNMKAILEGNKIFISPQESVGGKLTWKNVIYLYSLDVNNRMHSLFGVNLYTEEECKISEDRFKADENTILFLLKFINDGGKINYIYEPIELSDLNEDAPYDFKYITDENGKWIITICCAYQ